MVGLALVPDSFSGSEGSNEHNLQEVWGAQTAFTRCEKRVPVMLRRGEPSQV